MCIKCINQSANQSINQCIPPGTRPARTSAACCRPRLCCACCSCTASNGQPQPWSCPPTQGRPTKYLDYCYFTHQQQPPSPPPLPHPTPTPTHTALLSTPLLSNLPPILRRLIRLTTAIAQACSAPFCHLHIAARKHIHDDCAVNPAITLCIASPRRIHSRPIKS